MKKTRFCRRLRIESLEGRELLAVTAGGGLALASFAAEDIGIPQDTGEIAALNVCDPQPTGQTTARPAGTDVFSLASKPDSRYTIYLDFTGHVTTGTEWNDSEHGFGSRIVSPRFALDGNTSKTVFTSEEQDAIYGIWLRVAEDFMPFDVNVTTVEPSAEAFTENRAQRIVIGGNSDWVVTAKPGGPDRYFGYSFVGSFGRRDNGWQSNGDCPSFIFSDNLLYFNETTPYNLEQRIKNIAEEVSHELGHTLGIKYEKGTTAAVQPGDFHYYRGADDWAPIMGNPLYWRYNLTQWSNGGYPNLVEYGDNGETNLRPTDELDTIITLGGLSYRNDDHSNSFAGATTLAISNGFGQATGIIELNYDALHHDVDYFVFESAGTAIDFQIGGIQGVTNLDVLVKVYDSNQRLVETYDPTDRYDVEFTFTKGAGTYYLTVEGTGREKGVSGFYAAYGSLGAYTITASAKTVQLPAPSILTGSNGVPASYGANRHQIVWNEVSGASGYELAYSSDGRTWKTLSETGASKVVTGLTYGDNVRYRVRALGTGSYTDSEWSGIKSFYVCPMDIDGDGDITGGDRTFLVRSWLSGVGDENYSRYADIDADGNVTGGDRSFLKANWLFSVDRDAADLTYPPAKRADAVFAEFTPADIAVDLGVF